MTLERVTEDTVCHSLKTVKDLSVVSTEILIESGNIQAGGSFIFIQI